MPVKENEKDQNEQKFVEAGGWEMAFFLFSEVL